MTGALLVACATAQARSKVYVIPSHSVFLTREHGAIGLYVPGAGGTVSRAGAIAAIRRGKVESAALGGKSHGKILVDIFFGLPELQVKQAVLVELPPPGEHPNTKRYGVMILGPGYRGILTSGSTRIRGLVSIADLAPTAVALQEGRPPRIRSEQDGDAADDLRALDTRLARVHHDRGWVFLTSC